MIGNDIVDLALAQTESNWRRKGFLKKIFTLQEQQLIHNATDPERMVWLLWSMKESAYKAAVRKSGNRCFAPAVLAGHLTALDDKYAKGIVCYEEGKYLTQSSLTKYYISTVSRNRCTWPDEQPYHTGISPVQTSSSPAPKRSRYRQAGCLCSKRVAPGGGRFFYWPSLFAVNNWKFDQIIFPINGNNYAKQHTTLWENVKQHCAATLAVPKSEIHFHKDETGAPWLTLPSGERVPVSVSHHGRFGAFVFSLDPTFEVATCPRGTQAKKFSISLIPPRPGL